MRPRPAIASDTTQVRSRDVHHRKPDDGDTLIEILVAIVVISVTAVSLLAAFATAITASAQHRNLATNNSALWGATETAITKIQQYATTNFDTSCTASYSGINLGVDSTKYTVAIGPVLYWDYTNPSNQTFVPGKLYTSCAAPSYVPQEIPITITKISGGTSDSANVVVDYTP